MLKEENKGYSKRNFKLDSSEKAASTTPSKKLKKQEVNAKRYLPLFPPESSSEKTTLPKVKKMGIYIEATYLCTVTSINFSIVSTLSYSSLHRSQNSLLRA